MAHHKIVLFLLTLLLLTAVACDEQLTATVTIAPPPTVTLEQPPTLPDSTSTTAAPTAPADTPEAPATEEGATTTAPTPTLAQTPTAVAEATDAPTTFTVDEPQAGAAWNTGSTVTLSGSAPAASGAISASLRAAGLALASAEATPSSSGGWEMSLDIPTTVTGEAIVDFTVDGESVAQTPVLLTLPGATSGAAITLDHPQADSTVVSGQVLFFTGAVQRPPDETVTIAVLYEDCQTVASTTSFNVGAGGQWYGYIIVPETVFGPGCAVAYLGEFDSAGWLAAHAPIDILETDDPQARGVFIGNFPGSELTPGESTTVYGSAYNAPDRQVRVSLQVGGAAVAQGTTTADRFGYWEINLVLPADVAAAGEFRAAVSYDGEEVVETAPFEIAP